MFALLFCCLNLGLGQARANVWTQSMNLGRTTRLAVVRKVQHRFASHTRVGGRGKRGRGGKNSPSLGKSRFPPFVPTLFCSEIPPRARIAIVITCRPYRLGAQALTLRLSSRELGTLTGALVVHVRAAEAETML